MANWTNIPTDRIEPGKPIRAIDGLALRDNPIAIAQGAAGAPRIQEAAMNVNSIHGNRIRNGTITNTQIANNTIQGSKFNGESVRSWLGSQPAGGVGTYAALYYQGNTGSSGFARFGDVIPGSMLRYNNNSGGPTPNYVSLAGSWRLVDGDNFYRGSNDLKETFLFLRVS